MSDSVDATLADAMRSWERAGLRRVLDAPDDPALADFTSNDTLSLASAPAVVEAAREALARHGAGGRASRLLGGGSPLHARAEATAATWLDDEAALLFPSGYQATLGLVPALVGRGDAICSDALNHASLIDAARLSRARVNVYAHGDLDDLERFLRAEQGARRRLVLVEGVFSMDGDLAPLARIHELCLRHDAWLVVDEAHATGLVGPEGRGAWAACGGDDHSRLAARIVTGGKALGVTGAFVVGSRVLRDHLVNRARTFIYTTAPSPAIAGALEAAIAICRAADDARARTLDAARRVATSLDLPRPDAAIVPFPVAGASLLDLAHEAREAGLCLRGVRPPTVPEGGERLRIVTHAHNTDAEIDALVAFLRPHARPVRENVVTAASPVPLFVVGTDTDVGKTVVSALLLRGLRARGPVAYWKPVQTGPDSDTSEVRRLSSATDEEMLEPGLVFERPASPHEAAARAGKQIDPADLEATLLGHRDRLPDTRLLVELAGGLLVPYVAEGRPFTQADWLARSPGEVVLVARSGLGTLNHTLLTLEALRARHVEPRALFLVGPTHTANRETLARLSGLEAVFEVPTFDPLDTAALDTWLLGHDLTFLA